jgi:hypothetical protein
MSLGVIAYIRVIIPMLSKDPSPSGSHASSGGPLDEGCEFDVINAAS